MGQVSNLSIYHQLPYAPSPPWDSAARKDRTRYAGAHSDPIAAESMKASRIMGNPSRLRLTTRLQLAIRPVVLLVMTAPGTWFLCERSGILIPEVQQQTRAHARG